MAITIATDISDILPLVLQSYLAQTTDITDWQSFESSLGIQDTSALSYRGAIWLNRFSPGTAVERRLRKIESTYTIRLLISSDDIDEVAVQVHKWSRKLSELLEACATLQGQERVGGNLDGTFDGLTLTNATLDIKQGRDWVINVDGNKDGGGVGLVQNVFVVSGTI